MPDPNIVIDPEDDGTGGTPRYIPPEHMEQATAHLKKKGKSFRVVESEAKADAPSFLSFGEDAEVPMHAEVESDPDLLEPGTRHIKPGRKKIGSKMIPSTALQQRYGISEVESPVYASSPEEKASKKFRRAAQRQVNKREISFAPPGEDAFQWGSYAHFDPSLDKVIENTTDPDELADLRENEKESETYKAIADAEWAPVYDAHVKHGLPAVRVDKAEGAAGTYGDVHRQLSPAMYGFDMVRTLGLGRQGMSVANKEYVASAAELELMEAGIIPQFSERVKDLSRDSFIGTAAGFVGGARGALGRGAAKLAEKTAEKLGGYVGAGVGSAAAGGLVAMGEQGAEEIVETTGEAVRGAPLTVPDATEFAMTGLFGGALRTAGDYAGRVHDRLRGVEAPGGESLAQMEALTGEGGTDMLGGLAKKGYRTPPAVELKQAELSQARRASKKARDEAIRKAKAPPGLTELAEMEAKGISKKEARAARILKAQEDFPVSGGEVKEVLDPVAKRAIQRLHLSESEGVARWGKENDAFYELAAGKQQVPTAGVLSTLYDLYEKRAGFTPEGKVSDLPFLDTRSLGDLIEKFESTPHMNAKVFDESLRGLQEIIYDRGRTDSRMYKEIEVAMMKTRAKFGPEWAATKLQHKNEQVDLLNSFEAMGQRGIEKNADLQTSVQRAADKAARLGLSASNDEAWFRILREEPGLMEQMKQAAAVHPYSTLTEGHDISFSLGGAAHQLQTRFDPISGFVENRLHSGGSGLASEVGSASERALAAAGGMESDIDNLKTAWDMYLKLEKTEEDSNE